MADDIVLGAKQIPNPKGITPKLDTDNPDVPKKNSYPKDISNARSNPLVPNHPLEDEFVMKGIRHQPGRAVPKSHPAVQVSEN